MAVVHLQLKSAATRVIERILQLRLTCFLYLQVLILRALNHRSTDRLLKKQSFGGSYASLTRRNSRNKKSGYEEVQHHDHTKVRASASSSCSQAAERIALQFHHL